MYEEITRLKTENRTASKQRRAEIDARMQELAEQNPETFARAFTLSLKDTVADAEAMLIKEQIKPLTQIVSVSYIARHYFGKTKEWMYQRINGSKVNGKPARFTPDEIKTLNDAITDISKTIGSVRVSL